jgi:septal ring factor EnvC (AmiA/AmiB activator)
MSNTGADPRLASAAAAAELAAAAPIPALPDNGANPHEVPTPPIAAAPALTERLNTIAAEVAELEHALDQAHRMIETRDSELADLREANEQHVTTIHLLEEELADRSRRFDDLRTKVADLNLALET